MRSRSRRDRAALNQQTADRCGVPGARRPERGCADVSKIRVNDEHCEGHSGLHRHPLQDEYAHRSNHWRGRTTPTGISRPNLEEDSIRVDGGKSSAPGVSQQVIARLSGVLVVSIMAGWAYFRTRHHPGRNRKRPLRGAHDWRRRSTTLLAQQRKTPDIGPRWRRSSHAEQIPVQIYFGRRNRRCSPCQRISRERVFETRREF